MSRPRTGCPPFDRICFCQHTPSPRQIYSTNTSNAQAAPALHKTAVAAAAAAASKQQTAQPLLAAGRGRSPKGADKGLAGEASGRRDGESGGAMVVGDTGKSLLPEAVVRGLAYGMVNGILLPPVLVSSSRRVSASCEKLC